MAGIALQQSGIRKIQFAGHWAIEVGDYTWELWQDQKIHEIRLGEDDKGPLEWTDPYIVRLSDEEIVETEETLKKVKSQSCGSTNMTDTEIRHAARTIIDAMRTKHTALETMDRIAQWQFTAQMNTIGVISNRGRRLVEGMLGVQTEIRSGFIRAMRVVDHSDEHYIYDVFFGEYHAFAEKLANTISVSHTKTKLFFLTRANAKSILYNQMTLNSMPPSLQASLNQQQLILNQQQINQQQLLLNQQTM